MQQSDLRRRSSSPACWHSDYANSVISILGDLRELADVRGLYAELIPKWRD